MEDQLRPLQLRDFIGNEKAKKSLSINIISAQKRNDTLGHVLLLAKSGSGKTTLAKIIANELNTKILSINCANLHKTRDVTSILHKLADKYILFLDEIHRISPTVSDLLLTVLESNKLIIPGNPPKPIHIPRISIIGATTAPNKLDEPLRNRFTYAYNLQDYTHEEMVQIARMNMRKLGLNLDAECCSLVARTSKMVPRILNNRLYWIRDFKLANNLSEINIDNIRTALELCDIDEDGLDRKDRDYIELLEKIDKPVSLRTIADKLHLSIDYVEFIEQNLIRLDRIEKTSKGRILKGRNYEDFSDVSSFEKVAKAVGNMDDIFN